MTIKPDVYMIAGINGAGKTNASMILLPHYLQVIHFLNADEIAKGLSPFKPEHASLEAGRLMLEQIDKMINHKKNFAFETTGAGLSHIKTLEKCKKAGYQVHLIYLYISSVDIAIQRVENRVKQGGHNIAISDIQRRYPKGLKRFFNNYLPLADTIKIIDNNLGELELIASKEQDLEWNIIFPELWHDIQERVKHD